MKLLTGRSRVHPIPQSIAPNKTRNITSKCGKLSYHPPHSMKRISGSLKDYLSCSMFTPLDHGRLCSKSHFRNAMEKGEGRTKNADSETTKTRSRLVFDNISRTWDCAHLNNVIVSYSRAPRATQSSYRGYGPSTIESSSKRPSRIHVSTSCRVN